EKLIALIVCFMAIICNSINAHDFEVDNIYYSVVSKTEHTCAVVNNAGRDKSYSVSSITIPEKVTYDNTEYTVTQIGPAAFKNCIKLESVDLPQSITKMYDWCFQGCILLSSFTVPDKVENLPTYCFSGCISLESITINSVKTISSYCFKECSSLKKISIPAGVSKLIDWDIFCGCTSLKEIVFEDGNETLTLGIDSQHSCGIFGDCPVDSVYIGRNLTYSYDTDYYDFGPFIAQDKMKNTTTIGQSAFRRTALKEFIIGNKVTDIGNGILSYCPRLEKAIIGNGIQDLKEVIDGSNKIKNLYIGKGLKSFAKCCLCGSYGGRSGEASPLANANVYLFSDEVSSNYFYDSDGQHYTGGLPRDIKVLFVVNPERYQTLFGKDYNLKPMLVFNESSLEYTGKTPELTFKNYVEGFDVAIDNSTTPKDVGSYNTNVEVELSTEGWNTTIEVPCSYTITKAPLSAIVNNVQRFYGEDNPEFACTYIGFKNGETEEVFTSKPLLTTSATTESNAGTYPIYCTGAEAKNYNITCEAGTLTINKAPQTILWEQEFNNHSIGDEIELTAKSSASLPIRYKSSDNSSVIITTKGEKQYAYILKSGTTVLTAYQKGDINHEEADEINKVISVETNAINSISSNDNNRTYYKANGVKANEYTKGIVVIKDNNRTKVIVKE
ncbi:leucine-rich repeat protein, partial [Prevotella sp.]